LSVLAQQRELNALEKERLILSIENHKLAIAKLKLELSK